MNNEFLKLLGLLSSLKEKGADVQDVIRIYGREKVEEAIAFVHRCEFFGETEVGRAFNVALNRMGGESTEIIALIQKFDTLKVRYTPHLRDVYTSLPALKDIVSLIDMAEEIGSSYEDIIQNLLGVSLTNIQPEEVVNHDEPAEIQVSELDSNHSNSDLNDHGTSIEVEDRTPERATSEADRNNELRISSLMENSSIEELMTIEEEEEDEEEEEEGASLSGTKKLHLLPSVEKREYQTATYFPHSFWLPQSWLAYNNGFVTEEELMLGYNIHPYTAQKLKPFGEKGKIGTRYAGFSEKRTDSLGNSITAKALMSRWSLCSTGLELGFNKEEVVGQPHLENFIAGVEEVASGEVTPLSWFNLNIIRPNFSAGGLDVDFELPEFYHEEWLGHLTEVFNEFVGEHPPLSAYLLSHKNVSNWVREGEGVKKLGLTDKFLYNGMVEVVFREALYRMSKSRFEVAKEKLQNRKRLKKSAPFRAIVILTTYAWVSERYQGKVNFKSFIEATISTIRKSAIKASNSDVYYNLRYPFRSPRQMNRRPLLNFAVLPILFIADYVYQQLTKEVSLNNEQDGV